MLNSDQKRELLRANFSTLSAVQIDGLEIFLDQYCELILTIQRRIEREKDSAFDHDSAVS